MAGDYPTRETHFAHKFCRMLMRACAAQDIGPEACYMLTQIVHTEDAAHYRRGVRFFNDQLMHVCGLPNVKALQRARQRAVDAGWLHYEEGARGRPALYWVTIPDWAETVSSGGMDADCGQTEDKYYGENDQECVLNPSSIRPQSVLNLSSECPTTIPIPIPNPIPRECVCVDEARPSEGDVKLEQARAEAASLKMPANARESRHRDALALWIAARRDRWGKLNPISWDAAIQTYKHLTPDQWHQVLLRSAADGTKNLATYDSVPASSRDGPAKAKQSRPRLDLSKLEM